MSVVCCLLVEVGQGAALRGKHRHICVQPGILPLVDMLTLSGCHKTEKTLGFWRIWALDLGTAHCPLLCNDLLSVYDMMATRGSTLCDYALLDHG